MQLDPASHDLLVRTVLGEAGDQPDQGQQAVAHVVLNRLTSGGYGKSVPDVVLAPHQFEPWQTRAKELLSYSPESKVYQRASKAVDAATADDAVDPTQGATNFLSPSIMQARGKPLPDWAKGPTVAIAGHNFYAPGNPNYGKGLALGYTDAPAADSDPLGSWVKSLPATGKGSPTPAATTAPQADDPLASWAKSLPPESASSPVPLPVARPSDAGPSAVTMPADPTQETLPQAVNRWTAEHQGDSYADRAVRLGAGVLRGGGDVADTLGQGIASGVGGGANILANHGYISPETNSAVQNWRTGVNQGIATDQGGFDAAAGDSALSATGRLGGNVLASAPLISGAGGALSAATRGAPIAQALAARPVLSSVMQGAGTGAAANLLTSSTSDAPLGDQLESGAITGAALGPLGYGAARLGSRLLGGAVNRETAQLAQSARDQYGIPITAGQISANPTVRFFDSVMQRLPFTGYGARTAAQQTALNRAVSNTFGEDAEHITPQIIQNARQRIGAVFDSVAQRTGNIRVDQQFGTDLRGIVTDAMQVLPESDLRPLANQVQNIVSTFDPATGTLDARSYQALTRKGAPLDRAIQDKNPNVRYYAGQVRDALDDVMQRSAPADAVHDLIEARSQWKALKTVEPLAKKATTGDISPALITGAVNKSYTGYGGGGDLGNLGRIGQRFLKEPPSSGTPERNMILEHGPQLLTGALGLGGIAGATAFDPESWQRNAMLGAAGLAMGRAGSAALRSNALTGAMIRSGLRAGQGPGALQGSFVRNLPAAGALIQRRNALTAQTP